MAERTRASMRKGGGGGLADLQVVFVEEFASLPLLAEAAEPVLAY
jgi:hypothetical protein